MKLLEPLEIGGVKVKNRVIMTPMGLFGLPEADGSLTRRGMDFYTARARGGAGIVMPAATLVSTAFEGTLSALNVLDSPEKAEKWSKLAESVHEWGTKLGAQLSVGLGRVSGCLFVQEDFVPVSASASAAYWNPSVSCRPLTVEEISLLVKSFGRAAALAKGAGVDFIEIHGYGGYLLDQFMSSLWNERTDSYGGSLQGRMRFSLELVESVRDSCGEDFPLFFKFTPVHQVEGGRNLDEGLAIARILEGAGVCALHVDVGCYESWHRAIPVVYAPPASQVEFARKVKRAVDIPVIVHGKLGYPEVAESVLREGKADLVGLGRSFLADPEWVNKVRQGRYSEIVPCIGCSEGCMARGFSGKHASCAVNPACAMESSCSITRAREPRSVLVVGGGPAGLTAAIAARYRGHDVQLWEKQQRLGGNLAAASAPDFKSDVRRFLEYLVNEAGRIGLEVSLGRQAEAVDILAGDWDAVVIATGGIPLVPEVAGAGDENVATAIDVLTGKKVAGDRVAIVGGGMVGCETASFLADTGREVSIIERERILTVEPVFLLNYMSLVEMIEERDIRVLEETTLTRVSTSGIEIDIHGESAQHDYDSVVLALGFEPDNRLFQEIDNKVPEAFLVGDAVRPRRILDAVWEGYHAARVL